MHAFFPIPIQRTLLFLLFKESRIRGGIFLLAAVPKPVELSLVDQQEL